MDRPGQSHFTDTPFEIHQLSIPGAIGFAMNPPQFLHDGDEMLASIDRIGELRNRVVEV